MCSIKENNNLMYHKDTLTIGKSFKKSKSEYAKNLITKSPISAYHINLMSDDNNELMLAICLNNNKLSNFDFNPVEAEYEEHKIQHDIYSPGISLQYYVKDLNIISNLIITFKGEAHLFTNDSFYGYHIMVDFLFGGENIFKSCCWINSMGVNSNQEQLIPFINMVNEYNEYDKYDKYNKYNIF